MLLILSCQQGIYPHALNTWGESLELHKQERYAFGPKREVRALGGALFAFSSGLAQLFGPVAGL